MKFVPLFLSPVRSSNSLGKTLFSLCLFILFSCSKKSTDNNGTPEPPVIPPPDTTTVAAKFEVKDNKIVDEKGNEFLIKGINVNGPLWPWQQATLPDVGLIADTWKFNTVRINCWPQRTPYQHTANSNLDGIVSAFTAKKVVAIIEDHSFTGDYPSAAEVTNAVTWWTALATKYKGNPRVWFNIMNEPGNGGPAPTKWLEAHETIIQAIRGTGADNIIVCDEHSYGQVNGFDVPASSAAVTYGPTLTSKYKNLVFSIHLYGAWIYGKQRLQSYFDALEAKKLASFVGEFGVGNDYSMDVSSEMFKVLIPKKIGRIGWHWVGEDIHDLTVTGGGSSIDNTSGSKPGNLSFVGNLIWLDNHNTLTETDAALEPPAVIVANPNFEFGNPTNNSNDIKSWINFGTAKLDNSPANVHEGSFSARVDAGAAGGFGQQLYLKPGGNYSISGWGKHSAAAPAGSIIAVKYVATQGGAESNLVTLTFNSTSFEQQTANFTVPAQVYSLFLVVYKNDAAPSFWTDDIKIEKL